MSTVNLFLSAVLILVIVYILFNPRNQTTDIIHALGSGSRNLTRTLTGQYPGGEY